MKAKRILSIILTVSALMGVSAQAKTIQVSIDSDLAFVSDDTITQKTLDVPAFIENDITMVPLRFISETLGAEVAWNGDIREVTITKGDNTAIVRIDDVNAVVVQEGKTKNVVLNAAPKIVNDYTLVPLRFVSEGLNAGVEYVAPTRQVLITDDVAAVTVGDFKVSKEMLKAYYTLISYLEPYYGKEALAEAVYNEVVYNTAVNYVWRTIDPNCGATDETIAEVKANTDSKWAEYGILQAELMRIMSIMDVGAGAYSIMTEAVDDSAVAEFYKNNYVRAKHILRTTVDPQTGESMTDLQKKATFTLMTAIKNELDKGASFDDLIKKHGEDPGVESQPDGYVFTYGEMVEPFEKAAFALEEGKISDIIETSYGYHIIKREPLPELTPEIKESVKEQIASTMLKNMTESVPVTNGIAKEELFKYIAG